LYFSAAACYHYDVQFVLSVPVFAAGMALSAITAGSIIIIYTNGMRSGIDQVKNDEGVVSNIGYADVTVFKICAENIADGRRPCDIA